MSSSCTEDRAAFAAYEALCAKVDAFFEAVKRRHVGRMSCGSGCTLCCQAGLSVTSVEAAHISRWLRDHGEGVHTGKGPASSCRVLDGRGRCQIYPVRPLVCRSHGVPIRASATEGSAQPAEAGSSGETSWSACELNFVGAEARAEVTPQEVLIQETISTILYVVDSQYRQAHGAEGQRISVEALVAGRDDR